MSSLIMQTSLCPDLDTYSKSKTHYPSELTVSTMENIQWNMKWKDKYGKIIDDIGISRVGMYCIWNYDRE